MLLLFLLRHAKAHQPSAGMTDHARPLAERGWRQAAEIGETLKSMGQRPEHVLSSDSVRTRETFLGLDGALPEPQYLRSIYDQMDADYLSTIRQVRGNGTLMLIGHNMAIQKTASRLCAISKNADYARMTTNFPTCGLATIAFDDAEWAGISPGRGCLLSFATPQESD